MDIPPLKRRRVTYEDDELDSDAFCDSHEPLLLTEHGETQNSTGKRNSFVAFEDAENEDDGDFDDAEDSEEYDPDLSVADQCSLGDELEDLRAENAALDESNVGSLESSPGTRKPDLAKVHENRLRLDSLDKLTALRNAFPSAPLDMCESMLLRAGNDERRAYQLLRK